MGDFLEEVLRRLGSPGLWTEIIASILVAGLALGLGRVAQNTAFQFYARRLLRREGPPRTESYSERLTALMRSLTAASSEVDSILTELAQMARGREDTIQELEATLSELEERKLQLQARIQDLQEVPLPVAEHFAAMVAREEKRSAMRDYMLFGLGVVVSTVIAILLRLLGLG
jgi:hypothetical protein